MWAKLWGKSLDSDGMEQITAEKNARRSQLATLISQRSLPFDVDNEEHIKLIKSYVDDFEYTMNLIMLMQGMSTGLIAWGASLVLKYFIPVPDFVNSILTGAFYIGLSGLALKNCSINEFHERQNEMESLYLWALKDGTSHYDGRNNNKKLNHPEIQRLLKVIAPFSDMDLLIAWPRVTQQNSQPSSLSAAVSGLVTSVFSSAPAPTDKLRALQERVETNGFEMNAIQGLKMSLGYFSRILGPRAEALIKTTSDTLKEASQVRAKIL